MANIINYLLLDKDDITNVCGVINSKDLSKELTRSQILCCLNNGKLFRDKYILIENESSKIKNETFEDMKFEESKNRYFYVSRNGEFFTIDKKTGKKCFIKKYLHHGFATIKANNREYRAKNIVAQYFLGTKKRDNVTQKNNDIFDCSVDNLIVTPLDKYLAKKRIERAREIGLFENEKLVKSWNCVSECANELHYSKRTINAIINKAYKKQVYDLRLI